MFVPDASPDGCVGKQNDNYIGPEYAMWLKMGCRKCSLAYGGEAEPPCSEQYKCICMLTALFYKLYKLIPFFFVTYVIYV